MNVLVVNLTRFGDLLQSAAAVSSLADGGRVALVCLDNFAAAAAFLPHVDRIFPFPGGKMLAALQVEKNRAAPKAGAAWAGALSDLARWADGIQADFAPDHICNITPTTSARLLGRYLAKEKDVAGFGLDRLGFGCNSTPWAAFMQGASRSRGVSPFNVVDLFRKVAGIRDGVAASPNARTTLAAPSPDILAAAREHLASAAPSGTRGFVALQMGASEERRRWPEEAFAFVGGELWRAEKLCPVLLGSASERPLAERYAALSPGPAIDLVGRTALPELAATVSAVSLLISNDTGTLHLASGLGVPVLGIFLATAQPWDTGPYKAGNCSLEPDLPCHPCAFGTDCPNTLACHAAIRPETVLALGRVYLAGGNWDDPAAAGAGLYAGSRVWESTADAQGFADLHSLSGHEREARTAWLRVQRHFYRQFLDRDTSLPFAPQAPPLPPTLPPDAAEPLTEECRAVLTMLDALIQQGELLLVRPLPQVRERFLATWQRLAAFFRESPRLAALFLLWQEETQNSADVRPALTLAGQYRDLLAGILAAVSGPEAR